MIHILTVHWKTDAWIDIQRKYLNQFINEPFQVYAFLNQIPKPSIHSDKFFYTSTENIKSHAVKLNLLADIACLVSANEEDYLMFLDGDAFPVNDLDDLIDKIPEEFNLAAVQRLENNGDIQPHPCFCLTTVGYWKRIKGDWKPGNITWTNNLGEKVADVGGRLMQILDTRKDDWYKLKRTNQHNLHPLLFGVYDYKIYHHGAGFRKPGIRIDKSQIKFYNFKSSLFNLTKKFIPFKVARKLFFPLNKTIKVNQEKSKEIYKRITLDSGFYRKL